MQPVPGTAARPPRKKPWRQYPRHLPSLQLTKEPKRGFGGQVSFLNKAWHCSSGRKWSCGGENMGKSNKGVDSKVPKWRPGPTAAIEDRRNWGSEFQTFQVLEGKWNKERHAFHHRIGKFPYQSCQSLSSVDETSSKRRFNVINNDQHVAGPACPCLTLWV